MFTITQFYFNNTNNNLKNKHSIGLRVISAGKNYSQIFLKVPYLLGENKKHLSKKQTDGFKFSIAIA